MLPVVNAWRGLTGTPLNPRLLRYVTLATIALCLLALGTLAAFPGQRLLEQGATLTLSVLVGIAAFEGRRRAQATLQMFAQAHAALRGTTPNATENTLA